MQNKPKPQSQNSYFTFNGFTAWYNVGGSWGPYSETKDSKVIEGLIKTLGKLEIASTYYEDYDCDDRYSFIKRLNACALNWRLQMKRRRKRLHRKDWIRFDDLLETRLLVNSGRRLQSHQLTQALKLVLQKDRYPYQASFLVDSS